MNAATSLSSPVQPPKFRKDHFGRALMIGAIIEALTLPPARIWKCWRSGSRESCG
ncbi:hypothetical protein NR402_11455 [Acidithiobacillus ferrooxidans]|uniref:hypothetical protein n=1 Tax=Acidithiobacillus ferrooxidans TaxID=920 RepID=UPI0019441D6C|nr:hypothetical protein [Acidithiobacillus ferrooxidans]MCR2830893.1 hypothetical protein [Acidithiobacillus ferrooxidans]